MKRIFVILMFLSAANFVIAMNSHVISLNPSTADIDTELENRVRSLHYACIAGKFNAVLSILEPLENPYLVVSTPDIDGNTALHWAAQNEDENILSYLLGIAWQADELPSYINMRTKKDCLALDLAYMSNNPPRNDRRAIIKLLEEEHQNDKASVMVPVTAKDFIPPKSESASQEAAAPLEMQINSIIASIDQIAIDRVLHPTIFRPANRDAEAHRPSREFSGVRSFHPIQRRIPRFIGIDYEPSDFQRGFQAENLGGGLAFSHETNHRRAPYVEIIIPSFRFENSSPVVTQEANEYFENGAIIYGDRDPLFEQQWPLQDLERQPSLDSREFRNFRPIGLRANIPVSSMSKSEKLRIACRDGKINHVNAIIEAEDNPFELIFEGDEFGETALHRAIFLGDSNIEIVTECGGPQWLDSLAPNLCYTA